MITLRDVLDAQDFRDLHGQAPAGARVNHLGLSDHPVEQVFAAVEAHPRPAVRSGHIGNWQEIWAGQVGLVDYNRYICRDLGLGVPVVHAHTFSETVALDDGDTIYLPAGTIRRRAYERLPLLVKRGDKFEAAALTQSLCCAFTYLQTDSGPAPLVQTRAAELERFPGATTIPTVLCKDESLLRRALSALIDEALDSPGGLALDQVFGSSVNRQGQRGGTPQRSGGGFEVSGTNYKTRSDLVEAAVLALRYGSLEPGDVHGATQPTDNYLPLLGATTVLALLAYFDCHEGQNPVHAHWGAISMSGYPPVAGGYFGRRATRKVLRLQGEALGQVDGLDIAMRFALLPAPVLSLLPPAEFETDCLVVDELMAKVLKETEPPTADPSGAVAEIGALVQRWLGEYHDRLSPYYLNRFGLARSVFNGTAHVPEDGAPHQTDLLGALTMRQASILLGALVEEAKQIAPGRTR